MDRIGIIDINKYIRPDSKKSILSYNELMRIKPRPKQIKHKDLHTDIKLWKDEDGIFYTGQKYIIGNEKDWQDAFKKYGGNEEAVYVHYTRPLKYENKKRWFESEEEFLVLFEQIKQETPGSYATPTYTIKKRGYTKINPKNHKTIMKLPYFDVKNFPKKSPMTIAYYWIESYPDVFKELDYTIYTLLEKIVEIIQKEVEDN